MRSARTVATVLISLISGVVVLSMGTLPEVQAGEQPSAHVVTIQNMKFEPEELIVQPGSRVIWINKDLFPHTATGDSFDSGSIGVGESWSLVTDEPGDYAYLCTFHPTMQGRLIVR